MVDRSDPIAASAYSRSSPRDYSSRSSSRTKRGFEAPRVQNRSAYPHHSLGSRRAGIRSPLLQTGRGSARPSSKASGPPAVDAPGTVADDVLGLPSAKEAGFRSPTSATAAALSLWLKLGRSETTSSGGTSAIPASAATGGSTGKTAMASAGAGAGGGNTSGGLGAAATPAASPGMMAAPMEGSAWEACPKATRAAWAPRSRASCAEANQPAWRAAALAAEVDAVLRAFWGARPAEPCLRLLKGRDKAGSGHTGKGPKHRYPQILTRSGPRPIAPAGRPLEPRSSQALPRFTPLPASTPFPPRAPGAPKGRPAQAPS
jgi:hypothetical protein